ncbi:MAG: NAD-binding protein [Coriobacteriales bacterium]|jgi:3-hydroxyisobutyrate dehydrogenase|nr:NAD-binding protein [Coriobacteriales bacterium]
MSKIAFIWQGVHGPALIDRLAQAGHDLVYLEKSGQKTAESSPRAGCAAKDLTDVLASAEIVMTLLDSPQEVEEVYLAGGGIFEKAPAGAAFIDLTTSSPRLARELHALAAVHDHPFVEAPFEMSVTAWWDEHPLGLENLDTSLAPSLVPVRIFAAGEPDSLALTLPLLRLLAPEVVDCGLPGAGCAMRLSSLIAVAGALMGLIESMSFASLSGVGQERILEVMNVGACASAVTSYFGKHILDEDFDFGCDLWQFFNDLTVALDAADELDLVLPGLETAHQLYDLLVMVGGGDKGIHALALLYTDEGRATQHGLNWELAQRAMDVYERVLDGYDDDDYYYDDDDDCDDPECGHHHHDDDQRPSIGHYFSEN